MKKIKTQCSFFPFFISLTFLLAMFGYSPALAERTVNVAVSILPQKYFVKKIGGDRVHISVMVLPGANPATYEPKPRQMVSLTKARLYFAIGVPFEANWLKRFADVNPEMKIVATQAGITKIPMKAGGHQHHQTKTEYRAETTATDIMDPHIWLSPPLVMVQAKNIRDGLIKADPAGRKVYETHYTAFMEELKDLDLELKKVFQTTGQNLSFMVYHPSWGYFAENYGLEQIPIELEGKKPSPRKLQELIQEARKDSIKVIFVQPQFSEKSAETIANAIGGKVVFADPLAEDWGNNMRDVAEKLKTALHRD